MSILLIFRLIMSSFPGLCEPIYAVVHAQKKPLLASKLNGPFQNKSIRKKLLIFV